MLADGLGFAAAGVADCAGAALVRGALAAVADDEFEDFVAFAVAALEVWVVALDAGLAVLEAWPAAPSVLPAAVAIGLVLIESNDPPRPPCALPARLPEFPPRPPPKFPPSPPPK
jgi:hypothetical protein